MDLPGPPHPADESKARDIGVDIVKT